ncbi:MAG: glucosidase [Candidatus Sumerlaeia bacterium]|nr:glucosidase [Candidatus Sumerlaeia bacterium]
MSKATTAPPLDPETQRLAEDAARQRNWKRWGPYLSERQWGTVREDYSAHGQCWDYFPHEQARSRAYRWGEDGLLGITDRECRLCFALALWNGRDPILKERLFGLTGPEGNHGEDVKEEYFYLDSTPTHSHMRALYKYPQAEFPYARLVDESHRRGKDAPEFELADAGVFDESRYFDVFAEYAKAAPDDVLIRITVANRSSERASIHVLPTLWFRNTWSWGCAHEGCTVKPRLLAAGDRSIRAEHPTLGRFLLQAGPDPAPARLAFTENETNPRVFGSEHASGHFKDAFHELLIHGREDAVNPRAVGTKAAAVYRLDLSPGHEVTLRLRLCADSEANTVAFGRDFDRIFDERRREADAFYARHIPPTLSEEQRRVARQGYAGLLWSKQFYHLIVRDWLEGDPEQPPPPAERRWGRNHDWPHLYARDVISMPDKWEYPWFAAWDLAFHMVPMAKIYPDFAKHQLLLFLREWYMHPNGQIPAYEFAFGDVNPPVHAWAVWRVYKMTGARGERDRIFLARAFHKLLLNFTWWVNRKDPQGRNLFAGGFLGLDNIGVFDRSQPLPTGGHLEQADGTAWMAFFCGTMLSIALELASEDPAYEDVASKFFEHFIAIIDAMNHLGGAGLWDEEDGFYYDQLAIDGRSIPLKVRSLVGLIPLCAVEILEEDVLARLPGFRRRLTWFLENRRDLAASVSYMERRCPSGHQHGHFLLAIPSRSRLERTLQRMFDEAEFLSPHGIRSVSRFHREHPYSFWANGTEHRVEYVPGESNTWLFGGNSNWRGPVWFPVNFLLVEALERYHHFYGDEMTVEVPSGSGQRVTLQAAAKMLADRLGSLFLPDAHGHRPCHGRAPRFADDPHWRDLVLFHEYFHGDTGRGLGASHQTGWTALAVKLITDFGPS